MYYWINRLLWLIGIGRVKNGAIISDCHDDSAVARQMTRWRTLFGRWNPSFIAIVARTDELQSGSVQAPVHILNQIDAYRTPERLSWWRRLWRGKMVILVNSATRGSTHVPRPNGSPFCFWWVDQWTLVVSTLDGPVLPMTSYFGVIPGSIVQELDIASVMDWAVGRRLISHWEADRIIRTQFRSYEFQPLVAKWIALGLPVPSVDHRVEPVAPTDVLVVYRDSFGNLTMGIMPRDLQYCPGAKFVLPNGTLVECVVRLPHVKDGRTAVTIGSDGLRDIDTETDLRLPELVVQKRDAAEVHGLDVGDKVVLTPVS